MQAKNPSIILQKYLTPTLSKGEGFEESLKNW